ncbi:MAG: gliding motility-associated C-terminal domain-containing protein [Cyclobacteriaceae bacterium]|nr:gliding motility-associated C-terminal domain-containing protein [Cyclobacteriaceae bacterium]
MKRLFLLLTLCFSLVAAQSYGQEICDNGIDDDGDGFIDCFDKKCSTNAFCDGFYIGNDASCQALPPAFPQFTMTLDFASPNETTNHINRMAIGDLDRDGLPEIITHNRYTKRLFILNGNNGSVKTSITITYDPNWEVAIGNIDNDNCAEIFLSGVEGTSLFFYAYDCNLNLVWKSKIRDRNGNLGEAMDPINYGLADFDGDGKVELYAKDMIFDAHTGTRIINTATTTDAQWNNINGGPVAVDILGDDRLELVIGCAIYDITLGSRAANAGTRTLLQSVANYFVRWPFNATSVADFNQDGFLDVIASGSTKDGSNGNPKNTTIFFWDVHNNVVSTYFDNSAGAYLPNGWNRGTGRVNIADLDGDGRLNLSYVQGKFLYALNDDMTLKWRVVINEETSGHTGCTLFDFNGDGSSEIVYRDERFLYIIKGNDGSIYSQQTCVSRTQREYPIVADVDADGSTEICVVCGFNDNDAWNNFNNLNYSQYSQVRVYKSASEPWVPARRLWNQHGYFNVNVNNDLSIPRKQQKHHLVFSNIPCAVGPQGPTRPLNNFLNQSPFLDSQGCPVYASPDLAYAGTPTVNPPTCPDNNFTVSFQITNLGDVPLSGIVPVSFYSTNPAKPGSVKLNTISITLNGLGINDIFAVNNATVTGIGSDSLYIVLNDAGTTVPTPISLPNTSFVECDYDNIIGVRVIPLPVSITALTVQDNIKCIGSVTPDNGAVRAFIPTGGGGENTADYNFYWSIGGVAKPVPADFVGSTYSGIPDGTYTVYAIHKTANCNSDVATINVGRVDQLVSVAIQMDNPYTNCKNPNGKLTAIVNGGEPVGKFTYVWYEGNDIFTSPQIGVSHTAAGLKPLTYTVLVTDKATGCQSVNSFTVPDLSVKPVVSTSTVNIICSDLNSGSATATIGGVTAGYKFDWYNGSFVKPAPDFTGSNYTNRTAGTYTVVATDNNSKCESDPVTVTITQTAPPVVSVSGIAAMTSCDPSQPNGTASADVGGITAGYNFEWFTGQNTLPVNQFATTPGVTGLNAGIYTVKATDIATGCSSTTEVTINFNVVTPSLVLAAVGGLTNCTTPNGSVTVNVTLDTPADYTFFWYNGPAVKATPDFADTDNVLDGLNIGTYTVQAVHNTKNCVTAPISANVLDNTPIIDISLNAGITVLPSDCNSNDGVMRVDVSAPGNTGGFRIEWFAGFIPPQTGPVLRTDVGTSSQASGLSTGLYSVLATNLDNGCAASDTFNLPFANAHKLLYVSQIDVDKCAPTNIGRITVRLLKTPLAGFFESDYVINVHQGKDESGPLVQAINGVNGQLIYNTNNTLTPGFYTLVAISTNIFTTGCKSVPLVVEIKEVTNNPIIVSTSIDANTNCSGATANGQIQLDIDGVAPETNYSYAWFEGATIASPALGTGTSGVTNPTGNIASSLPPGIYTVLVTNISPTSTACSATATYQIFDNPPIVSMSAADLVLTPQTLCPPLANDASATVTTLRENGVAVGVAGYTFQWLDAGLNILPSPGLPNTTNTFAGLAPGTYFVRATKIVNNCSSALVEFTIEDQTMNTVAVDLIDFTKPTRCLKPLNITGELIVNPSGTSGTGYTVNWYAGPVVSGPVVFSGTNFTGITIPLGQSDITFTTEVINNSNQCRIVETYTIQLDTALVTLTASAAPVTFCSTDNGEVFATVTSGNSNDYDYNWSIGPNAILPPDFVGKLFGNLGTNDYTVIAIDQADNFCQSNVETVTVDDDRVPPIVTAIAINAVTNCDPTLPNGFASASVGGSILGYTFDWYENFPPAGVPLNAQSTPEIGDLRATIYSVIATDIVTGCSDTTQVTISNNPVPVPAPQIEVLSNVTTCAPLPPDGALAASVNGNTKDFKFFWYNTNPGVSPDTTTAVFKGEFYRDLPAGTYFVSVVSRITGCAGGPVSAVIIENPVLPDFTFTIESATCKRDASDPGDGFVTIILTNPTDLDIESIVWTGNGVNVAGPNLAEVDAGVYSVTVTTAQGCFRTKDVEIKSDIRPFNGISRNGDSQNDFFRIICLEEFPNNVVKIFNRAGTLVYEAAGYDNETKLFDGRSNKGISVMGTDLPDGTYFYVIDKRDGSKPLAGYLEIVN